MKRRFFGDFCRTAWVKTSISQWYKLYSDADTFVQREKNG